MSDKHQLQNAMFVLSSTPDAEIAKWMEASFVLLERMAGPSAKNIERQRERRDLDGDMDKYAWIAARIRYDGLLTPEVARLKHDGEMLDRHLRTPVVSVKKMGRA